jgi:cytochrome c oxidase subunit II
VLDAMLQGVQSVLNPRGPHAEGVAELSWLLFIGGAAIFVAVMAVACYALFAPRDRAQRLSARWLILGGGVVFPVTILTALLLYTMARTGAMLSGTEPAHLRIAVTGEQWWWRVTYLDEAGRPDVVTANEIHIPTNRSVEMVLDSADVIHSFWVPTLAGKVDMIPGRTNRLRISAREPGRFRGQCAEYCGGPHAFMAFLVVVEEPDRFSAWLGRQRQPAADRNEGLASEGQRLFLARCAACHTVRGTPAAGRIGPDLTHVGSRHTIAAGMLTNNPGTLAGWIASSQHIKPGNLMPSFKEFSGLELRALADYLAGLK